MLVARLEDAVIAMDRHEIRITRGLLLTRAFRREHLDAVTDNGVEGAPLTGPFLRTVCEESRLSFYKYVFDVFHMRTRTNKLAPMKTYSAFMGYILPFSP